MPKDADQARIDAPEVRAEPTAVFKTVDGFMEIFPVGKTKIYELIGRGTIVTVSIGRRRLIDVSASLANIRRLPNDLEPARGRGRKSA